MTKYEALVYIALLKVTSATASEIHDSSGVPRASVYPVLDQLLDKDLVTESQSAPKRFAAITPTDAIGRLTARIGQDSRMALESLTAIHQERIAAEEGHGELIWNIYGITGIRKRLAELIGHAKTDIRIIAHSKVFSEEIKDLLNQCSDQIRVDVITPVWDGTVPKSMNLYLTRSSVLPREREPGGDMLAGGVCIIDGKKVMVIVGSGEEDAVALFSESIGFVSFFIRYYDLIIDWVKMAE
jgi:sugar-specific transcriptional regulator TrmB